MVAVMQDDSLATGGQERPPTKFDQLVRRIEWATDGDQMRIATIRGCSDVPLATKRIYACIQRHGFTVEEAIQAIYFTQSSRDALMRSRIGRIVERLSVGIESA